MFTIGAGVLAPAAVVYAVPMSVTAGVKMPGVTELKELAAYTLPVTRLVGTVVEKLFDPSRTRPNPVIEA